MRAAKHSTSNKPLRFEPFAEPGRKLATLALLAFLSAAVSFRCLTTRIDFILGAQVRRRTRLVFWTRTRERSLDVAMLPSRMRLSSSFGKMRQSLRRTLYY